MSLSDAIKVIAERMDVEASEMEDGKFVYDRAARQTIKSFSNELKIALKASEGVSSPTVLGVEYNPVDARAQHRAMIEAAKQEFRKTPLNNSERSELSVLEERLEGRMIECCGGSMDGTMVAIDSKMRAGAETSPINGEIYKLGEDNRLHYLRPRIIQA